MNNNVSKLTTFILCLCFFSGVYGQSSPLPREIADEYNGRADYRRKKNLEGKLTVLSSIKRKLYRKATKKEYALVAVNPEDTAKYKEFSTRKNSGVIKLVSDLGCPDPFGVISAKPECLKYSMPGNGAAFSFRETRYRLKRLADLVYADDKLNVGSKYTLGIISNLGEVALNDISLKSDVVKELVEIQLAEDTKEIEKQFRKFEKGVTIKDYFYSNSLPIEINSLYVMRSIAYRAKSPVVIRNVTFNEFKYDKREEIIVAFKIIRKDEDKSLTIVWKELKSKKSPKLNLELEKGM